MQMMGSGLLAEIKAKQERRAHKVGRDDFYKCYKCSVFMREGCTTRSLNTEVHVLRHVQILRQAADSVSARRQRGREAANRKDTQVIMGK